MNFSYKTYIFVNSLYYGLLAIVFPVVYAVTYQVSVISVFSMEWLCVTIFLYPIVLLISVGCYSFKKMRTKMRG